MSIVFIGLYKSKGSVDIIQNVTLWKSRIPLFPVVGVAWVFCLEIKDTSVLSLWVLLGHFAEDKMLWAAETRNWIRPEGLPQTRRGRGLLTRCRRPGRGW